MLRVETGNLVTGNYPVFCHQVNCKGVMGAGVAKQIRDCYPEVYRDYKHLCRQGEARVGDIQIVNTTDDRICVNLFAQYGYGRDRQYTNYEAFMKCLIRLQSYLFAPYQMNRFDLVENKVVAFPMYIGCGLAGGDWKIMHNILKEFSEQIPWDVVLVKLKR